MARITKKSDRCPCPCCGFAGDWFYCILIILVGAAILGVNLGWISGVWLAYWPAVLVVIGVKELLEDN